jgi:DNA polymerase epsilon subunit 1
MINQLKNVKGDLKLEMEAEKNPTLKMYDLPKRVNYALEVAKCAFKIFGLCPHAQEAIEDVRSQAMVLLGKQEISADTFWQPPKVSVILEQMFCQHCTMNVNLDICAQEHPESESDGKLLWVGFDLSFAEVFLCPICVKPFSKIFIEEQLMDRVTQMQTAYFLQDYKCTRCKQVDNYTFELISSFYRLPVACSLRIVKAAAASMRRRFQRSRSIWRFWLTSARFT